MRLFLLILLLPLCGNAATYYVDGTNSAASDSNPGTAISPWKTIGKAATNMVAGDTVIIQPAEYNEFVVPQNSGTAANPITYAGVRGNDGSWLSIVDPSTTVSNGWIAAPDIGAGVWKQTNMLFDAKELTINHKRVVGLFSMGDLSGSGTTAYLGSNLTNGYQFLTLASNAVLYTQTGSNAVTFWDGIEALYGTTNDPSGGYDLYLRLRDGSSPNGLNVRACKNKNGFNSVDMPFPCFLLHKANYCVVSNILMRGAFGCVDIESESGGLPDGHNNVIVSNSLANGYARVNLTQNAYSNTVTCNRITTDYYGYTNSGAWAYGTDYVYIVRQNLYLAAKFLMGGQNSSWDYNVRLHYASGNNVISSNSILPGLGIGIGIDSAVVSSYGITTNTIMQGNSVSGQPSIAFSLGDQETGTRVYNNFISDSDCNIRLHNMDLNTQLNRIYIYRNTLSEPPGVGQNFFFHFNFNALVDPNTLLSAMVYQNSATAGATGLSDNGMASAENGLTNCLFVNNIFNGHVYYYNSVGALWTNTSVMGGFDYNILTPPIPGGGDPVWLGVHNNKLGADIWSTNSIPNFALSAGSPAIDAAIDTTAGFTVQGRSYPALPQDGTVKTGLAWDIGALEFQPPAPPGPSTVITVNKVNVGNAHFY